MDQTIIIQFIVGFGVFLLGRLIYKRSRVMLFSILAVGAVMYLAQGNPGTINDLLANLN